MVDEIILRNKRTGEEIKIDKTGDTGFVLSEIDWGTAEINNESYRIPFQVGETLSSTVVGTRVPTITGYVVSNSMPTLGAKWNDYINNQKQEIINLKNVFNHFISIYDTYQIIAGDIYIEGIPSEPVRYSNQEDENNEVLCLFELEFNCYDPLFRKINIIDENFIEVVDRFRLPFTVPVDPGNTLIFGEYSRVQTKNIVNNGDVSTGFIMTIRTLQEAVSTVRMLNVTTGVSMEVHTDLQPDDYIVINTNLGQEDAYIHKVESDKDETLLSNIYLKSKFIQLERGDNYITYQTDNNSVLDIEIQYDEKYFNFKEM